jgi:heterotetrameric sarcosine oxidase beta subunit
VTGIQRDGARVTGVETTRGPIGADTVCLAVAGHSSHLAAMVDLRLPIETHVLQAFVTESIKPVLDVVMTYGAGHFYVSQSDRGGLVYGGAIDGYNSYGAARHLADGRRGRGGCALTVMPALARLKVVRQWGGVMDMSMDGSPIISRTPLEGCCSTAAGAMAASRPSRPAA